MPMKTIRTKWMEVRFGGLGNNKCDYCYIFNQDVKKEKKSLCLMEQVGVQTRLHVSAAVPHLSHDEKIIVAMIRSSVSVSLLLLHSIFFLNKKTTKVNSKATAQHDQVTCTQRHYVLLHISLKKMKVHSPSQVSKPSIKHHHHYCTIFFASEEQVSNA